MKIIQERPVNISNEFSYKEDKFRLSPTLKQYEVKNFPVLSDGKYNNWTNEAEMDSVIVIDNDGDMKFLDQNGKDVTNHVTQV